MTQRDRMNITSLGDKGPSSVQQCAEIVLKGNSYQRGVQYGKHFKGLMKDFYDWFVKKEPREIMTSEYKSVLEKLEEEL